MMNSPPKTPNRNTPREKGELISRKRSGGLREGDSQRMIEVNREMNRIRRGLKKVYIDHRLGEVMRDLRATLEILGEALLECSGKRAGVTCGYF